LSGICPGKTFTAAGVDENHPLASSANFVNVDAPLAFPSVQFLEVGSMSAYQFLNLAPVLKAIHQPIFEAGARPADQNFENFEAGTEFLTSL